MSADMRSVYLDAARAFAAILVFSSHARGIFLSSWRDAAGLVANGIENVSSATHSTDTHIVSLAALKPSHQAVILFFVLSGYFVGGSVLKTVRESRWSWKVYLTKRLTRLWLVLIPALVLTQILDGIGRYLAPAGSLYSYIASDAPMLIGPHNLETFLGNALFLQGILVAPLGSNDPLWSLAYEFWYYIAFPFLAFVLIGKQSIVRRVGYFAIFCTILFWTGGTIAEYFSIWLMGLVPHLLKSTFRPVPNSWVALGAALVLLTAVGLIKSGVGIFPADLLLGAIFTGWVYLAKNAGTVGRDSIFAQLAFHGSEFSYTLYLVHVPALIFLSGVLVGPWRSWPITSTNVSLFSVIWGSVLLYAFGIYWLFERNTAALQQWAARKTLTARSMPGISP